MILTEEQFCDPSLFKVDDCLTSLVRAHAYLLEILHDIGCVITPYGSRVVCDPPVLDTDIDFMISTTQLKELDIRLIGLGFAEDGDPIRENSSRPTHADGNPDFRFFGYRRGLVNIVVTESDEFAKRHRTATSVCKKLNLLKKDDRIMIYQAVLYGEFKE